MISTALLLPLKPHCFSGTTLEEDPGEDLACYGKKRDSSIVPTVCSITFLVDGYKGGIIPCLVHSPPPRPW